MPPQAYDHPAFLSKHQVHAIGVAGASGVILRMVALGKIRVRNAVWRSRVAGTTAGHNLIVSKISGTTTTQLGTATLSTLAANTFGSIGDMFALSGGSTNAILAAGDVLIASNGTDATGVADSSIEYEFLPDAVLS